MKDSISLCIWLALVVSCGALRAQPGPGAIIWKYEVGASVISSPAVAPDGTLYVATGSFLHAITNAGAAVTNRWSVAAQVSGSPAIGADGTIYFLSQPGPLNAFSPDGTRKWTFPVAIAGGGSPAIGVDGTIYFFSGGRLYAVSQSGTEKWDFFLGNGGFGSTPFSPVIGTDGTIYVADGAVGKICAFTPDGTNKWCAGPLSGIAAEAPAVAGDGTLYYADGPLYAFSNAGSIIWSTDYQYYRWFGGIPVIGPNGEVYVAASLPSPLWAVTSTGQPSWSALGSIQPQINTPAVDAGGTVYYCVSNSIWAVNAQGTVQWAVNAAQSQPGDTAITSPIISAGGILYAALGSTVYAIATGTNGPANSPWPMYQQNARHTGKVEKPVLKQPQKRSDANFEFHLYPQQLGLTYTVESSSNLYNWTSVTSFVANTVPTDVVDLTASNAPARVYRAFSGP